MDWLDPALPVLIRTARSLLDWSQGDLAKRAGVAANTIGRLERCEGIGRPGSIEKLVAAFKAAGVRFRVDEQGFGLAIEGCKATAIRVSVRAMQLGDAGTAPPHTRVRPKSPIDGKFFDTE